MLNLHRALIALRREFVDEPYETLAVDDAVLVFRRGEFVVALNLSGEPAERPAGRVVLSTHGEPAEAPAPERGRRRQPVTGAGSTAAPRSRSSKCRCGPVARPVAPTLPSSAPAATHWPRRTEIFDRCAYQLVMPSEWRRTTSLP